MSAQLDHLVVGATSLDEGVAWCQATLGVTPGPGGEHPLMGTHNRLLRVATVDHPRAYLEIIAVQPGREPQNGRRWFDLDDETVRDQLRRDGPQLLHFVARVPDVRAAAGAWHRLELDPGEVVRASRLTPRGLLEWQITVRADGRRLLDGTLPTLIEWGATHPASSLPETGVTVQSLWASHPDAARLRKAFDAVGMHGVAVREGPSRLCAELETPRGRVRLASAPRAPR
jgi:hypothetical protein